MSDKPKGRKIPAAKVKSIAKCFGPGPELFFSMDTESEPGTMIIHFVRFKTLHVKNDGHFDNTNLTMISVEADPRLGYFFECYIDKEDGREPSPHVHIGPNAPKR